MDTGVRVFVVAADEAIREQLRAAVASESGATFAGESDGTGDVYSLLQAMQPEIVVVDYDLPEVNGGELTRRLQAILPRLRIVGIAPQRAGSTILGAGPDFLLTRDTLPEIVPLLHRLGESSAEGST